MQILVVFLFVAGAFAIEDNHVCGANQEFNSCGTACPLTCDNYNNPPRVCTLQCVAGCHCAEGFVRTSDGKKCVLPENCPNKAPKVNSCLLPSDSGMCRGYFPMFYYDAKDGECKEFVYGGCQGNGNRFATAEECLATCGNVRVWEAKSKDVCDQPIDSGLCMAFMHRYGYDKAAGKCKKFMYGGCAGNENNFESLDECRQTCLSEAVLNRPDCDMDADPGLCQALIPRFYYADGECKKFTYGGCGGNKNNFETEEECYNKCGALSAPVACTEDKDSGPCLGVFHRFYFNRKSGKCEQFIFGGCQGNSNNFEDQEDCEAVCMSKF